MTTRGRRRASPRIIPQCCRSTLLGRRCSVVLGFFIGGGSSGPTTDRFDGDQTRIAVPLRPVPPVDVLEFVATCVDQNVVLQLLHELDAQRFSGGDWFVQSLAFFEDNHLAVDGSFEGQALGAVSITFDSRARWRAFRRLCGTAGMEAATTETSASALIGYGLVLGVRSGALTGERWLEVISRAAAGLQGRVEDHGDELVLEGISFGTNPGDYDYYVSVPLFEDTNMGLGAALMMLSRSMP